MHICCNVEKWFGDRKWSSTPHAIPEEVNEGEEWEMLGNLEIEIEIDYNTFIVNMFIQKHLIHINVKSKHLQNCCKNGVI